MRTYLGIDQGGSKTHAIICDEKGVVLGMGCGKGACHSFDGLDAAREAIQEATEQALSQSGTKMAQLDIVAAGLTGVDWDYEEVLLTEMLAKLFPSCRLKLVNDCIIALRACSKTNSGAIICAGSGLNCAIQKDSETQYIFGYYIADAYQGGRALGKTALDAVLDAEIGLECETLLTSMLFEKFGVDCADKLLHMRATQQFTDHDYLSLPLVLEKAAMQNDALALKILADFGERCARYVVEGMRKLSMLDAPLDVYLSGSIFKCRLPIIQEAVSLQLHRHAIHSHVTMAKYEPIVGAMLLALDESGREVGEEVYRNIENAASKFKLERN